MARIAKGQLKRRSSGRNRAFRRSRTISRGIVSPETVGPVAGVRRESRRGSIRRPTTLLLAVSLGGAFLGLGPQIWAPVWAAAGLLSVDEEGLHPSRKEAQTPDGIPPVVRTAAEVQAWIRSRTAASASMVTALSWTAPPTPKTTLAASPPARLPFRPMRQRGLQATELDPKRHMPFVDGLAIDHRSIASIAIGPLSAPDGAIRTAWSGATEVDWMTAFPGRMESQRDGGRIRPAEPPAQLLAANWTGALQDPLKEAPRKTLYLASDGISLDADTCRALDRLAARMKAYEGALIIRSHAAHSETPDIARRRALGVRAYLARRGVAVGAVQLAWLGGDEANLLQRHALPASYGPEDPSNALPHVRSEALSAVGYHGRLLSRRVDLIYSSG